MGRLEISDFGCIKKISIDVDKNMNLIIGPQASGKSTVAKVLYFCKKIRDYYVDFICDDTIFLETHCNEIYVTYLKYVRRCFMGCFGTTKHMQPFEISYSYPNGGSVSIHLRQGYARLNFSPKLEKRISESLHEAHRIYNDKLKQEDGGYNLQFIEKMELKKEIRAHFSKISNAIFGIDDEIIYIPAGRSLLSVLSDKLDVIDVSALDLVMKDFVERIRVTRNRFGTKLDNVVDDYLKTVKGQIKNADIDIAKGLINKILKATYVSENDGEKLYFDDSHWVKLNYSSSGQQESLWILLLLFVSILESKKCYIILEEPEAHLYPAAQRDIMELVALTMNSANCKFFVTTHSPYILSSTNLLIQSAAVENAMTSKTDETVVRKQFRIEPKKVSAYEIGGKEQGKLQDITDKQTGLIDSLAIDRISEEINLASDKLIDMEIKYGL